MEPPVLSLVERDADLAVLTGALAAARTGHGTAVLVEGEAGIGKTALLTAACAAAGPAGLRLLRARGTPLEEGAVYGVARQLVLPVLGRDPDRDRLLRGAAHFARPALLDVDSPGPPTPDTAFAIREGLAWLVAGLAEDGGPLALVVDDLHWADAASVRFLQTLATRISDLPVAVLLASRPGGAWTDPDLAADVESAVRVVRPARLTRDGVATALARRLRLEPAAAFADAAHAETAGTPYLVDALAEGLRAAGIAPTEDLIPAIARLGVGEVGRAIAARVRSMDPDARATVRAVAVWGDGRPSAGIEGLAGLEPGATARAAPALDGAGLLRGWPELAFDHPLVRAAVLDDLDALERIRLHDRAADMAVASGELERAAAHLGEVPARGSAERAAVLHQVGARALHRGVPDVAARHLRRALAEAPPEEARGRLLFDLGLCELALGDVVGPDRLAAAAEWMPDPDGRLRSLMVSGYALTFLGRWDEAFDRMRDAVGRNPDASPEALALARLDLAAVMLTCVPTGREAAALLDRLDAQIGAGTDLRPLVDGAVALRDVAAGVPRDAVLQRIARAAAGRHELPDGASPLQGLPLIALVLADAFTEAETAIRATIGGAGRRLDAITTVRVLSAWLALNRVRRGRITQAEEAVLAVDEGDGPAPAPAEIVATLVHASIAIERGDLATAASWADRPLENDPRLAQTNFADGHLVLRARVRLAQGDAAEAHRLLTEAGRRQTQWGGGSPPVTQWRTWLALATNELGRVAEARALIDEELAAAKRFGAPRPYAAALRARAVIQADDVHAAERDLRTAATVLDGSEAELEQARVAVDLGDLLLRRGRTAESLELLRPALDAAWTCGADALAERARAVLVRAGARPRRPELTGVRALTPAEARTARMAIDGMTNRELAEAMFVTEKTVETHLTSAYRKLGIAGRRHLAAALGQA